MVEVTVDVLEMDVEIHGGATVNADAALDDSWTTDISCSSIIEDGAEDIATLPPCINTSWYWSRCSPLISNGSPAGGPALPDRGCMAALKKILF